MDQERQRIEEDLRGLVAGEVRCDDLFVQLYASDASIYEIRPLGVVRPRSVADVVATVEYAGAHGIPIHARGSGSGLAGESLGRGIIVDFSRFFRRLVSLDGDTVCVQPGVVLDTLNGHLARHGRMFGPDPALGQVTTVGGMLGVDAAGSHWLRYGSAQDHVRRLEVVLADGSVVRVGQHAWEGPAAQREPARLRPILREVGRLLHDNEELIQQRAARPAAGRSGYTLANVRRGNQIDLARLITGSEGTLALITEATLATVEMPTHRLCALLFFESLEKAARAATELSAYEPSACDLMDRRHLSVARELDVRYELLIPRAAEAVLLVEQQGDRLDEVRGRLREMVEVVQRQMRLAAGSQFADDEDEVELFWRLARHFVPAIYRLSGSTRPIPFVEDMVVPPQALPEFLHQLQDVLKREDVTASLLCHAAHGQLHLRPFLDLSAAGDRRKIERLAEQIYDSLWQLGGSIGSDHGDGLSRTPYLDRQRGALVDVDRELKRIFDPQGILNPGKIVSSEGARVNDDLRMVAAGAAQRQSGESLGSPTPLSVVDLQLDWRPEEVALAARSCNGCGACRDLSATTRMCPIFRLAPREEASPRAKANLVRSVITGAVEGTELLRDQSKEIADLCVHCHMCRLECPSNVDIPKLMLEAKANYVLTNGQRLHDQLLTRVDTLAAIASRISRLSNWLLANGQGRWVLEKVAGVAQGRKLPRVARRPFTTTAKRRGIASPRGDGERVVYFVDTFANRFDTQLAEAFVAVLEHNGISVFVPEQQKQAGMPLITQGVLDAARPIAEQNVALLADAVRQGYRIVATEPSAALALTHEYPLLLDNDPDAQVVAEASQEACHYLWRLHQRGRLRLDFQSLNLELAYHAPCHLLALDVGTPAENLLRLIPGLQLTRLQLGCSGMAGLYGLKRKNYRASLRAGLEVISAMRSGAYQAGATECSTCRIQLEQSSTNPTFHPVKLLAMAYRLLPDLSHALSTPAHERVLS